MPPQRPWLLSVVVPVLEVVGPPGEARGEKRVNDREEEDPGGDRVERLLFDTGGQGRVQTVG